MITRTMANKGNQSKMIKIASRFMAKVTKEPQQKGNLRRENIVALPYDKESADVITASSKLVLIRHGNSMFNKLFHELEGPGYVVTPKYFDIYSELSIIDSPLSPLGIKQCKEAAKLAHEIEFDTIFLSPLRRAVETAYHIFCEHPNFDNMKFVLHPLIRENIMTAGDIPGDINALVDKISLKFPNLNTSLFPRGFNGNIDELYYARDLTPELTDRISGLPKRQADLILCEEIKECFPKSIEKYIYTNGRVQLMKDFFRDFIIKETLTSQGKIAIVGHSYFFKLWTGLWHDQELMYRKQPNEYVWLDNCELFPDVFNFPLDRDSPRINRLSSINSNITKE